MYYKVSAFLFWHYIGSKITEVEVDYIGQHQYYDPHEKLILHFPHGKLEIYDNTPCNNRKSRRVLVNGTHKKQLRNKLFHDIRIVAVDTVKKGPSSYTTTATVEVLTDEGSAQLTFYTAHTGTTSDEYVLQCKFKPLTTLQIRHPIVANKHKTAHPRK